MVGCKRLSHFNALEADLVAWAQLAQAVEVGVDNISNFRITTQGLTAHSKNDPLVCGRSLNEAWAYRFAEKARGRNWGWAIELQTDAHAVAAERHCGLWGGFALPAENVPLGAGEESEAVCFWLWGCPLQIHVPGRQLA